MKQRRRISFIHRQDNSYPEKKPGVLVVYRLRYLGPDSIYQYHVIFRHGIDSSLTLNCVDAATYRKWLLHYSELYPVVEIYHGTRHQDFPVTTFLKSVLYTNEFYKWWHGRVYVIRGSVMWGHEFEGRFGEVVSRCLDYGLTGEVQVEIGNHYFVVPATMEDLTAFRLRESELFEGYM